MKLHGATASHVGNLREANQDRAWFRGDVAALADGMGGHQGGERAAELAIGEFKIMPEVLTPDELIDVVEEANRQVHKQSVNPDLRGMGTTMVALGLHEDRLLVVNVGDSRAYLCRDGKLSQITIDHSFVEELVRQGRLTPQEAAVHPQRNIVTRALGIGPEVEVDEFPMEPKLGDRYLLASDGLFSEVDEKAICAMLTAGDDPAVTSRNLVTAALATPCRDNVTVAVVDVVDNEFEAPEGYEPEQVLESTDRDITAPVPIVAPEVVKITDRPDGAAAATGGGGAAAAVLERDPDDATDPEGMPGWARDTVTVAPGVAAERRLGPTLRSVAAAALVIAGLVAAVYFAVGLYARSSYFVGEVEDELVVYQGRKGGFLWVDGELLDYRSGVAVTALTDESADTYLDWENFSSIDSAREAIEGLEVDTSDGPASTESGAGGDSGEGADQGSFEADDASTDGG